jgi:integrase
MPTKKPAEFIRKWLKSSRALEDALVRLIAEERAGNKTTDEPPETIAELQAEVVRLRALVSSRTNALPGRLTPTRIAALIKKGKDITVGDTGNLYLQIRGGAASWLFRWNERVIDENGNKRRKERVMGLGSLNDIGLFEARDLALQHRKVKKRGRDPKVERDAALLDARIAAGRVKTVRQVADEYYDVRYAGKSDKRRRTARLHIDNYIIATIGDVPIEKVDTNMIVNQVLMRDDPSNPVLHDIWNRKNPTGGEVQGHLDRMFDFARSPANKYYSGDNPASWEVLQYVLPSSADVHQTEHHKSLPYKDAGRFFCAVRNDIDQRQGHGYRTMPSFALEFTGLTGVRIGEVIQAQWKEFDFDEMIWNVPAAHKKNKKASREIPITSHMLNVLDQLRGRRRDASRRCEASEASTSPEALVFSGYHGSKLAYKSVQGVIKRVWPEDPTITVHGLRSTLRDWCRANRFPPVWWLIQVDHKDGDKTSQSYGHDPLTEERRGMMELYGEHCSKPTPSEPKTGKVVKLSDKRRTA